MTGRRRRLADGQDSDSIQWIYFPKSKALPELGENVIATFAESQDLICSSRHDLKSNQVLRIVGDRLDTLGFEVEQSAKGKRTVSVPVLFGLNGRVDKSFHADAWHRAHGFVIEVEAGRGVLNNQFLKDLFQACMMQGVKILCIAVRSRYKSSNDFDSVCKFFETLYSSQRLSLPLDGVLLIGY